MRLSRERNCSVEMPGSTRCSSTNRRGPAARSRTINSVHLSPTRSSARASGDHWSYGCRFGGGTCGIGASLGVLPGWESVSHPDTSQPGGVHTAWAAICGRRPGVAPGALARLVAGSYQPSEDLTIKRGLLLAVLIELK